MSSSPSPPAEERPQLASRASSNSSGSSPSVRVRRTRAPTVAMPSLSTITSNQVPSSSGLQGISSVAEVASSPTGRRRRGTITERLFAGEGYFQVEDGQGAATGGRARSPSQASRASSGRQAVDVSISGEKRRRGSLASSQAMMDDEHHHDEEVQVLDVLDQAVSTTAHLSNIQSAFWPNAFTRQPVVDLEPATPPEKAEPTLPGSTAEDLQLLGDDEGAEDEDPLGAHLRKVMKKQKRKETMKATLRGVWAFLKTPLGVFAAIYMILVVVWGAGLVFLLIIPMNSYIKKLWVEIASQILTGLFTITSLLPLPWRTIDWVNAFTILHYARITERRRRKRGLPPLRDPNDLPESADAEYWVGVGGEKMTGPRVKPVAAAHPKKTKSKDHKADTTATTSKEEGGVELSAMEAKTCSAIEELEDEMVVLSDKEQHRLHRAQLHFSRSQTYYRAHTTPTHHAFPLWPAFGITVLMIGNSVFQAMLCGVMWGMDRFERPAWTTGCLIPLSFGCMIGASVMIWIYGERTKRKDEVSRKVWEMLKQDEADLEARRKAIIAKRVADKEAKKHRHAHGHAQAETTAPAPAPVRF